MGKQKSETPEKLTQKVAVRKALEAGKEQPAEGAAFVKENFGMTLSNQAFSTLKSQLKRPGGTNKPAGKQTQSNGSASTQVSGSPRVHTGGNPSGGLSGNPVELAQAVKALVKLYGADTIKQMADLFAE